MPREVQVCDDFRDWGLPKLRPLINARDEEARTGIRGKFRELLAFYMEEYEQQPFAQPDFHQYLKDDKPVLTADVWRKASQTPSPDCSSRGLISSQRADEWFRNHTRPKCLSAVSKFETLGGHSELSPFRATSAMELWATTEPERIYRLICAELGVSTQTDPASMPPIIGARKTVLKREFAMLPQGEQEAWRALARERKEAADREGMAAIAVQERQEAFSNEIHQWINKSMKGNALGQTFMVSMTGCYVEEATRKLQRFKGHYTTIGKSWHDTAVYKQHVAPHWTQFVNSTVKDMVIWNLQGLKDGDVGDKLMEHRQELKSYFENMFRLYCDFDNLDVDRFWADVADNPNDFVAPGRLPRGTRFVNPLNMREQEFRDVYDHVYRCQTDYHSVDRELRFVYEADIVNLHVAEVQAKYLKAKLKKKRKAAVAAEAASADATAADALAVAGTADGGTEPAAAQVGLDAPAREGVSTSVQSSAVQSPGSTVDSSGSSGVVPRVPSPASAIASRNSAPAAPATAVETGPAGSSMEDHPVVGPDSDPPALPTRKGRASGARATKAAAAGTRPAKAAPAPQTAYRTRRRTRQDDEEPGRAEKTPKRSNKEDAASNATIRSDE